MAKSLKQLSLSNLMRQHGPRGFWTKNRSITSTPFGIPIYLHRLILDEACCFLGRRRTYRKSFLSDLLIVIFWLMMIIVIQCHNNWIKLLRLQVGQAQAISRGFDSILIDGWLNRSQVLPYCEVFVMPRNLKSPRSSAYLSALSLEIEKKLQRVSILLLFLFGWLH